jgi:hypothetical protein
VKEITEQVKPSRAVFVEHPFGFTLGNVGERDLQRKILLDCLAAAEEITGVMGADERWLTLRFDAPPKALPHEGMPADGDSGAPVLMRLQGTWALVGLVLHKSASGELKTFRCCLYGQITYQVRISRYVGWIDAVIHRK